MTSVKQSVEWELAGEAEILGENPPQCHFVRHKSHMTWPGLEPGPPTTNRLSYGTAKSNVLRGPWTHKPAGRCTVLILADKPVISAAVFGGIPLYLEENSEVVLMWRLKAGIAVPE
jgi:hypothetical protein